METETGSDIQIGEHESLCLNHEIFCIDWIVLTILKILDATDILTCRLLTVRFSYHAERLIMGEENDTSNVILRVPNQPGISPPEQLDSSSSGGQKKTCRVCGDAAKSEHFGGLSCDGCKQFFRRSVIANTHPTFLCAKGQGNCKINVGTRKMCQSCRFKKCRIIGMRTKWVKDEDERQKLQNLRKQKRDQKLGRVDTWDNDPAKILMYLTPNDQLGLTQLVLNFYQSHVDFPYQMLPSSSIASSSSASTASNSQSQTNNKSSKEFTEMLDKILRRLISYQQKVPEFSRLTFFDQTTLLLHGFLQVCELGSTLPFRSPYKNLIWPYNTQILTSFHDRNNLSYGLCGEFLDELVKHEEYLCKMRQDFRLGLQNLQADEPTILLLSIIVIFESDRDGLMEPTHVEEGQQVYLELLRKYLLWRFRPPHGSTMFPKLLAQLVSLRQFIDTLQKFIEQKAGEEWAKIRQFIGQRGSAANSSSGSSWREAATLNTLTPAAPLSYSFASRLPSVTCIMFHDMVNRKILALFNDLHAEISESEEILAKQCINLVLLREVKSGFSNTRFLGLKNAFNEEGPNIPIDNVHFQNNFDENSSCLAIGTTNAMGFMNREDIRNWLDWWWSDGVSATSEL